MTYVFDTNAFIHLFMHFYLSRFPTLWRKFDDLVGKGRITSVREVAKEIESYHGENRLTQWAKVHREVFTQPTEEEMQFVGEIFGVTRFQALVSNERRLSGGPVADPFVVAKARTIQGCVVTQEQNRPNGAKIPNACEHFEIDCTNLEGFMEREGWSF